MRSWPNVAGRRAGILPDMSSERASGAGRLARLGRKARAADGHEPTVRALHALRRRAPGRDQFGTAVPADARTSDRLAGLIAQVSTDQPSVTREVGLGAVQLWQAAGRVRGSRAGANAEVTIVFTDLVGFSDWALMAGDDQVLRLLRDVGKASERVITRHGGSVVKSLGDGLMAVFVDTRSAVEAAHEACTAVSATTLDGYRPQLRVGLHRGYPRKVRDDYLGVDVNIASRVADAASGGEVLLSGPALDGLDIEHYTVRRRRRFRAKGTPKDLDVYSVVPRYSAGDAAR